MAGGCWKRAQCVAKRCVVKRNRLYTTFVISIYMFPLESVDGWGRGGGGDTIKIRSGTWREVEERIKRCEIYKGESFSRKKRGLWERGPNTRNLLRRFQTVLPTKYIAIVYIYIFFNISVFLFEEIFLSKRLDAIPENYIKFISKYEESVLIDL